MELRVKGSGAVPYGYKLSEDNEKFLISIPEELEALQEAKEYLNNCSWQEVCDWLERKTGRRITRMGLKKALARGY